MIASGAKKDVTIIYSPDHQSELYADVMRISLSSHDEGARIINLYGKCRNHTMYIRGAELLTNNLNSETLMLTDLDVVDAASQAAAQAAPTSTKDSEDTSLKVPIPILVTLYSIASPKNIGEYSTAEKIINIGCMKTNPNNAKKDTKKNGDFTFENSKEINAKGFSIDLAKVKLDLNLN